MKFGWKMEQEHYGLVKIDYVCLLTMVVELVYCLHLVEQFHLQVLEQESKDLRSENAKLQSKLKHLEDNIEGMKRLKEEHMLSIMHRTEQLQKISSGTE